MGIAKQSKIEFIENSGPNNLQSFLKASLAKASNVDIAVAFISKAGIEQILPSLRRIAAKGKVRIIVGLYQGVTEPQALGILLQAQFQTKGNVSVRLSRKSKFHAKYYIVEDRTRLKAVIGSSNLTKDGLLSDGEFNTVLIASKASPEAGRLRDNFENEWEFNSVPLAASQIKRYEQARSRESVKMSKVSIPIKKIIGASEIKKERVDKANEGSRFYRDWVNRWLVQGANQVIIETTNWVEKGYDFINTLKPKYRRGDKILLFDFLQNYLRVVEIKDTTRTPISTPEGRYFAAYLPVKKIPNKRLTKTLWRQLNASGLVRNKDAAQSRRKLTQQRWDEFIAFLRTK